MELSQIPAALQSRLRLSVIAALLSGSKKFRTLQDLTGATAGNLGKQLEQLEELRNYDGDVLLVTHSRDEIYRFCSTIHVINEGEIVVSGAVKDVFKEPETVSAAKLTGCKNFFKAKRVDAHTVELTEWGLFLHVRKDVPENCEWIGYRAHDFIPVWGERKKKQYSGLCGKYSAASV